jgi:hypothetical protein
MENGGRVVISPHPAKVLPSNNLNAMVQELKLGQSLSIAHDEGQMRRLNQLQTLMDSVVDLQAKAGAI